MSMLTRETEVSPADDMLLTPDEVASLLRKNVLSLANDRNRGEGLPYVKAGRLVRYRMSDVLAFIEGSARGFTWSNMEASLRRYGMDETEAAKVVAHLRRDM
jgi:hypothetical protein